jgi:UDP-glucose 4-epimerase
VLALGAAIGVAAGVPFEPAFAPARLGEVQRTAIDPSRAAAELGWRPATSLAEGLRLTLATAG